MNLPEIHMASRGGRLDEVKKLVGADPSLVHLKEDKVRGRRKEGGEG